MDVIRSETAQTNRTSTSTNSIQTNDHKLEYLLLKLGLLFTHSSLLLIVNNNKEEHFCYKMG